MGAFREFIDPLAPTPGNIARAKAFVIRKWKERAAELGRESPETLENACKFCSMFAQKVFGGKLEGNYDHQYVRLPDGSILDLTDAVGLDKSKIYRHDRSFWNNREHRESMDSCVARVNRWTEEFEREMKTPG